MTTFMLLTRLSPQSLHQPKSSSTVRSYGNAHTEVWLAMPCPAFEKLLRQLPAQDRKLP